MTRCRLMFAFARLENAKRKTPVPRAFEGFEAKNCVTQIDIGPRSRKFPKISDLFFSLLWVAQ